MVVSEKNLYISTFPAGFQEAVALFMKDALPGFACIRSEDGMLAYHCSASPADLISIPYVSNSFLVILSRPHCAGDQIAQLLEKLCSLKSLPQLLHQLPSAGRTFRIMGYQENQPAPLERNILAASEAMIARETGMRAARAGAQVEFWCYARRGGDAYFMRRLTKRPATDKNRAPGELNPEVANILCMLSQPTDEDIFLDPFCGHGTIPLARVKMPHRLIFAGDSNPELVRRLRQRIKDAAASKKDPHRKMVVYSGDALQLSRFNNGFITKIVTDPPWGLYNSPEIDLPEFYLSFFKAAVRVLTPEGLLVLLSAQKEICTAAAPQAGFELQQRYDVLISGKKAVVLLLKLKPRFILSSQLSINRADYPII